VNIRTTASGARAELKLLEAKLAALKSSRGEGEVESVRQKIRELEKQIRAIEARAQQVEDAAFDLKAVNPRAKANEDTRSAAELLSLAEAKGRQVEEALARLRRLLV